VPSLPSPPPPPPPPPPDSIGVDIGVSDASDGGTSCDDKAPVDFVRTISSISRQNSASDLMASPHPSIRDVNKENLSNPILDASNGGHSRPNSHSRPSSLSRSTSRKQSVVNSGDSCHSSDSEHGSGRLYRSGREHGSGHSSHNSSGGRGSHRSSGDCSNKFAQPKHTNKVRLHTNQVRSASILTQQNSNLSRVVDHCSIEGPLINDGDQDYDADNAVDGQWAHSVDVDSDESETDEIIEMLLAKANRRILKLLQHLFIAELVEIVAPLQYACLHTFAYLGWNSKHFVDFDEMEEDEYFTGLYWMLIMSAVELVTLIVIGYAMQRATGISAWHMVSYTVSWDRGLMLASMVCCFTFASTAMLKHCGMDLSFDFEWLDSENKMWSNIW
jgi:hypothetical protein